MSVRIGSRPSAAASPAAPLVPGPARAPGVPHGFRVPAHRRTLLANGTSLTMIPRRGVPLVAFCAVLRGGALGDAAHKPGVAHLTAALLDKGAGARDAYAFAEAVEGVGGSFAAVALAEHVCISGQFLARDQALMLELLADTLVRPHLPVTELDKLRARQIELIRSAKDNDPAELLGAYGRAFLFADHPYGRPPGGEEASLAVITREDVEQFYHQHIGADRLSLIFAGDVDCTWLGGAVTRAFSSWRAALGPEPRPEPPHAPRGRGVLLIDAPGSAQSYFWIGAPGIERTHPRRAAIDLVNTVYGGRFTSLLNTELRVRAGLTYGAASGFTRSCVGGDFTIRCGTPTGSTASALELAFGTLTHLRRDGITQPQLDSARAYVLGQYPLSVETAADWAAAFAELEAFGLGPDHIESYGAALNGVSLADARAAIATAFPEPEGTQVVLIGDRARVRHRLHRYGALTETSLARPTFRA